MFIRSRNQFLLSMFNKDYFILMWELGHTAEESFVNIIGA